MAKPAGKQGSPNFHDSPPRVVYCDVSAIIKARVIGASHRLQRKQTSCVYCFFSVLNIVHLRRPTRWAMPDGSNRSGQFVGSLPGEVIVNDCSHVISQAFVRLRQYVEQQTLLAHVDCGELRIAVLYRAQVR